jgi:hypothetical protein
LQLKQLAKQFGARGGVKAAVVSELLVVARRKSGLAGFLLPGAGGAVGGLEGKMAARARALAGECYRLQPDARCCRGRGAAQLAQVLQLSG